MRRYERMHGRPGVKYGIYNTSAKQFQFGISEDTPCLAEARLMQKIGDDARKWRFEARRLPAEGGQASDKRMKELEQQNKHFGENGDAEERQEWKERMLRNFLRGHE